MLSVFDNLYSVEAIRKIEALSIQEGVQDAALLMKSAAGAALKLLLAEWPELKRISVFCGPGLNGADGLTLAYLASQEGLKVTVFLAKADEFKTKAAQEAFKKCQNQKINVEVFHSGAPIQGDLIVDALFGIGLNRPLNKEYIDAIEGINAAALPVFALDIPSGINADTGSACGAAVRADLTLTFIAPKQGLFTNKAVACCGKIVCDDLQLPTSLLNSLKASARLLGWKQIKNNLPLRARDAHKGIYGHVLVIGGDYGMGGAVRMAAEAALRVGAGLVSVATRPEHVSTVNACRPEIMCHQVQKAEDLEALLQRASVVVIGPGLGQSEWAKSLLTKVLESTLPKVLDADALNLLSLNPKSVNNSVLTPHPAEAARLLSLSTEEIQADRFKAARELQQAYQGAIVLKGAGTLVQAEDAVSVCRAGNPGMATAGMGDVLSGAIGGLLAQGFSLKIAAEIAVFVHAVAADRAAAEGGERGLLASDLMQHLRRLVNPQQRLITH